jgi:hypothetical protein
MAKKNPNSKLRIKQGLNKINLLIVLTVEAGFYDYFSILYEATTVLFK